MKKSFILFVVTIFLSLAVSAQTNNNTTQSKSTADKQTETKPKKTTFRATKDQITQAQKMLGVAENGKMDDATRAAVKKYQSENGLKTTGSLNRATLEKMNVALTDKQKEIPVAPDSFASPQSDNKPAEETGKKRGPVFRATKEQIMQAQKLLKDKGMYAGAETGSLSDETREGLRKFQAANGAKVTGTLNKETLEKMGIALTERQKEM